MNGHGPIVPLVRGFSKTFSPSTDEDGKAVHPDLFNGRSSGWEVIEEKLRCVMIADAGAGKTHEMLTRARYAEERGRCAFFIRIENISAAFETAFDAGDAERFERWLESNEKTWFFSIPSTKPYFPLAFKEALFGTPAA